MNQPARKPTSPTAPKVFICYRREETAAHAGRLYDAMVAQFGERNVFMDVDIEPGVDFVERIGQVVSACQVLIVVMGPNWATVTNENGDARIADPEDFVRLEVENALRRPEVTPIPVLVGGARMPKRDDLPPAVQAITRRNALELSDARWGYDVKRLNGTLDGLIEASVSHPIAPKPQPTPGPSSGRLVFEGTLVGGAAALAARWLGNRFAEGDETASEIAGVVLRQTETWAITGAALAIWLAIRTGRTGPLRVGTIGLLIGAIAGAIGGALYALPIHLPTPNLTVENAAAANAIAMVALAVTGGFLGALIGALWQPPRRGPGLAGGVVAGALTQLVLNGLPMNESHPALAFSIRGATIAGLTLAVLHALDLQRSRAKPVAGMSTGEP